MPSGDCVLPKQVSGRSNDIVELRVLRLPLSEVTDRLAFSMHMRALLVSPGGKPQEPRAAKPVWHCRQLPQIARKHITQIRNVSVHRHISRSHERGSLGILRPQWGSASGRLPACQCVQFRGGVCVQEGLALIRSPTSYLRRVESFFATAR